jgi:hypothetical protein
MKILILGGNKINTITYIIYSLKKIWDQVTSKVDDTKVIADIFKIFKVQTVDPNHST